MKILVLLTLSSSLFISSFASAASAHPDLQVYEELNNPTLFQKRISYGFSFVARNAGALEVGLNLMELTASMKRQVVTEADKKATACVFIGMLTQQIASEVNKFAIDKSGWATANQKTQAQLITTYASEAGAFCGLAGNPGETPATTLDQALDLVKQIERVANLSK